MERENRQRRIHLRAADVMTSPVITIQPDTSVKDVAAAMVTHHFSGFPVVTVEGELIGIVTEADLLHKEAGPFGQDPRFFARLPAFGRAAAAAQKASGLVARDVMTSPVVTVDEGTSLHEVAALMVRRKINRVPALRAGRLVGIVSRADVVRALVRPDDEIATAVREALLHDLWVDISKIRIDVKDGIVYLDGQVDRHSEKDLVERWVASIDGVVGVDSKLTFEFDDPTVRRVREVRVE
jgi:CBS domain-containing protein